MDYRPVEADSGQIGGSVTCEFMRLPKRARLSWCIARADTPPTWRPATAWPRPTVHDVPKMEKVATPGVHTIAELAEFLDIPESSTVKALSGKNDEGASDRAVHPRRPRAQRAEGRARGGRLHAAFPTRRWRASACTRLDGPGGAARGSLRHRGAQPAGGTEVGRGRQRGRLPLRGRAPWRGLPGGRVGRFVRGASRRQLPRVRPSA